MQVRGILATLVVVISSLLVSVTSGGSLLFAMGPNCG